MKRFNFALVVYITICVIGALYTPQPLLNVLRAHFGVSEVMASLLVSLTLFPLGVAPIAYGVVLERVPPKRLLLLSVFLLALSEVALALTNEFFVLLGLRVAQGLLIPAALTSLMTFIAQECHNAEEGVLQRTMASYVAATICGGFFSRFLAGAISAMFHWRWAFGVMALVLASALLCVLFLKPRATHPQRVPTHRMRLGDTLELLRRPGFLRAYMVIFCAFFVFAAMLNFLPFRLNQLNKGSMISEFSIGLMYLGYLMGVVASLNAVRFVRATGSERRAVRVGLVVYALAVLMYLAPSKPVMFLAMFVFCGGMFTVHSVLPGYLNKRAADKKGIVNGLYISFYYAGGTVGAFLPGFAYQTYGWGVFSTILVAVLLLGYWLAGSLRG